MALNPGSKLGPYEIVSLIGAGGMGEVYKARDTRLNRTVAVKVLPSHFSDDPEMKARFEREARTIAGLNHPHICILHDVGHKDGTDYLVMEFLEGQTLAERLEKGGLPIDQALKIAREIVDALNAAHRRGIVHRDLKPSNVMLTKSGTKLLDFGLAKLKPEAEAGAAALSSLPTNHNVTAQGNILGTLQYMAPEQLEGKDADSRADIFAFGALLYEMVTGKKAFAAKSQASLIAAIMHVDPPDISTLQPLTPASLSRVVKICLNKNPDERWQASYDLALELEWAAENHPPETVSPPGRTSKLWPVIATVLAIASIVLAMLLISNRRPPSESPLVRVTISPPEKTAFEGAGALGLIATAAGAISPDGQKLAFTAKDTMGRVTLWVRTLDNPTAQPLPDTDDAGAPFWSPDGEMIAFFAQQKLKTISLRGGPSVTVADASSRRGGSWSRNGTILFTSGGTGPLSRVASTGGAVAPATQLLPQQSGHRFPWFLPDGKHFLYMALGSPEVSGIYVGSLDSAAGQRLLASDSPAVYAPSGHLLFVRGGTLLAQSFDANTLQLSAEPVPIAEQVAFDGPALGFSVSETGTLAYRTGAALSTTLQLVMLDRSGKLVESVGTAQQWLGPDLSPDGKRLVVHRHESGGGDVWLTEVSGGKTSRLTFDASQDNSSPIWSPDGNRIAFGSRRNGKWGIYTKLANGSGNEALLVESSEIAAPASWSANGNVILYSVQSETTRRDVWAFTLSDRKAEPLFQTPSNEQQPQMSPDGKWIAYSSDETSRAEIYIQSFPPGAGKWQISNNTGLFPRWRADGKELFYMDGYNSGKMLAVEIHSTGSAIEFTVPRPLFDTAYLNVAFGHPAWWNPFSVTADGQRFLITRSGSNLSGTDVQTPIHIVLNWTAALKKK